MAEPSAAEPSADVAPHLIVLALLEQGEQRAMPLQGQSLREALPADGDPAEVGRGQVLELLVRVWQRSAGGPCARWGGEYSLLLLTVPIDVLQEQLPALKARWIASGDTPALLRELRPLAGGLWSLAMEPRGPVQFRPVA